MANSTTTITKKFQIHIPVEIRKAINLNKPTSAKISTQNGKIIIEPKSGKTGYLKQVGSLKGHPTTKTLDIDNIRDHIDYSKA